LPPQEKYDLYCAAVRQGKLQSIIFGAWHWLKPFEVVKTPVKRLYSELCTKSFE
jgi:hypothetical protein